MSGEYDLEVLVKVAKEVIVRECDLESPIKIIEFRRKIQLWVDLGIVHCEKRNNPNDLFEEEFHYSLTEDGEKYYNSLQPSNKQRQSDSEQQDSRD